MLHIDVNLLDHIDMLVAAGFLAQWDDHDRLKIEEATANLLQSLAEASNTRSGVAVEDDA